MRRLIVHIPDLEHLPEASAGLPAPLGAALGRAPRVACRGDALTEALPALLGIDEVPAAAVCSRLSIEDCDRPPVGSCWLRADPVWLVPDLTAVWIERPAALDLGADTALAAELEAMFRDHGLEWTPAGAGAAHGVLALDAPPDTEFPPLSAVPGRRLDEMLPEGPLAARWRRLINESQMLFHQYRDRISGPGRIDQRGIGLWFWGAGALPSAPDSAVLGVIGGSGSAVIDGLARWQQAEPLIVDDPGRVLAGDGPALLLHWPLDAGDPGAGLERLSTQWLAPAGRGRLAVIGSHGYWNWTRLRRWTLRRRAPQGFVHEVRR